MKLIDLKICNFIKILSSKNPTPGGGSVAALNAVLGCSLINMVLELTLNNKKYKKFEIEIIKSKNEILKFNNILLNFIDEDTNAFNIVANVFKMPKETEEQKKYRKISLQKALIIATEVPYKLMNQICSVLYIAKNIIEISNINALSDLGSAAENLCSALKSAWLNVLINLSNIKDKEFCKKIKNDSLYLFKNGCNISKEIYKKVLEKL